MKLGIVIIPKILGSIICITMYITSYQQSSINGFSLRKHTGDFQPEVWLEPQRSPGSQQGFQTFFLVELSGALINFLGK